MTTFGHLIVRFFSNHLASEKGSSPNTIASYSACIKLLLQFACEDLHVTFDKLDVAAITHEVILRFLDSLETTRSNTPKTRNQRLAAIKTFFRFLALQEPGLTEHCQRICAIQAKNTGHKVIQTLDLEEVQAMIDASDPSTLQGSRDRALLLLMYNTAARVQSLIDLDIADVRIQNPPQVTLTGKGQKQYIIPLRVETVDAIHHHIELRKAKGITHPRLFLNARGAPLTRFGIEYLVDKYRARAARTRPSLIDKHVTPHTFRHTTALHLIQSGVDITTVKYWLNHADIKTTSLYIDIDIEMKRNALEQCEALTPRALPGSPAPQWLDEDILDFLDRLAAGRVLCGADDRECPANSA